MARIPLAVLTEHERIAPSCQCSLSRAGVEVRTTWIADAHRGDGKRFVVHADEKLTAFVELESVIRPCGGFH